MEGEIDRSSDSPLYAQLGRILHSLTEALPPDSPLPSEAELQRRYLVSRTVIRQALTDLKYKGLVYGVKGVGNFVARPKVTEPQISTTTGLTEEMTRQGHVLTTKMLSVEVAADLNPEIMAGLNLGRGQQAIHIERLRFLNGEPLLTNSVWLPFDRFRGLESLDLTDQSLYRVLDERFGASPKTATRAVDVVYANEQEAEYLEIRPGEPLLRIEGYSSDQSGLPLEWSVALHRADRAKLTFSVNQFAQYYEPPYGRPRPSSPAADGRIDGVVAGREGASHA